MAERDEAALLARVVSGDTSAFEDLLRPYEGRVFQVVLRITQNPADAADVYQEAVLTAFQKAADFQGAAAFGTWLHRIAVNRALMRRRSEKSNPVVFEEDLPRFNVMGMHASPVSNWAESAEAPVHRAEVRAALSAALDALPDIDRTIVWMKDVEGASHEDIAEATGLTVLAARTRLHRARLVLRTRLQKSFGENP